jgi:thioredoxin-like negative regulator of GroEL
MSLDRFLLSILLMAAFAIAAKAFAVVNRRNLRSRSKKGRHFEQIASGTPTLLYFWTSDCALCVPQERQIEQARAAVARKGRRLEVRKINAFEEAELAKSMNVRTVPTTVLVDAKGRIAAWNAGLREARKLLSQFESVS